MFEYKDTLNQNISDENILLSKTVKPLKSRDYSQKIFFFYPKSPRLSLVLLIASKPFIINRFCRRGSLEAFETQVDDKIYLNFISEFPLVKNKY